jgi:excisionase family DNA binding protein
VDKSNQHSTSALLPLEEVARQLGIHIKTARRQIREGHLQAVKVGRQYRVAASELARVMGQGTTAGAAEPVRRERHVEASTIVQIDAISPEDASRIVNGVGGAIKGRDRRTDTPLRVDTIYDETRGRLKVIVSGSLASTSFLLQLIAMYTG